MSDFLTENNAWAIPLPDDWQYYRLSDLISFYVDNRGKTAPTDDTGIPLIATNCIKNENLYPTYEKVRYVSQETYDEWFRAHPEPNDIIIVNKGTPGLTNLVPDPVDFVIAQDMMAIRANEKIVYPFYLFTALRSPHFLAQVNALTVGTTIPHLKKGDFDKLIVPVPPIEIQKDIGNLYINFSYKIELNSQMNRTLEEALLAFFKSWFIDWDPVYAKMRGEQLGLIEPTTVALFPDEIEEQNSGSIPLGWSFRPLIDCATYINGAAYKNIDFSLDNSGLPVIKIAELKNGISSQTKFTEKELDEKYYIDDGEILFSWSGNPETSIDTFIWTGGPAWLNQHIFRVVMDKSLPTSFVYILLRHMKPTFTRVASNKQTTGLGHVTKADLERLTAVIPSDHILHKFDEISKPLLDRIYSNMIENRTLIETRDTLLPKIVNGDVQL